MNAKLLPYVQIARPDHWFKNVFVLPGILFVFFFDRPLVDRILWLDIALGWIAACLVASSNYVLNEILDAEKDRHHPEKQHRPVPSGRVSIPLAYTEWLVLAAVGFAIGFAVNWRFGIVAVLFWIAGALYNVPPIRWKDRPYADVLSESLNNPIRFAMGWYSTGYTPWPPMSALLAYWMFGAFLMAMKRYAEFRHLGDSARAARYRRSFTWYNEERLVESLFFYGSLFGMLSGFFLARYHVEAILATPVVAYAMAYYMHLAFAPNSPVQNPERLFRQKKLMLLLALAFVTSVTLLLIDLPALETVLGKAAWSR